MYTSVNQLLAAVQQKAPQLTKDEAVKVTTDLLNWMSQSLDGIPEFRDMGTCSLLSAANMIEGIGYDKAMQIHQERQDYLSDYNLSDYNC